MTASFIQSVDARTNLAGANQLEVLLFKLGHDTVTGREEVFGINVFKVREVMHIPEITHAPEMPSSVEGMVSLRGVMMPVINLQSFCNIQASDKPKILIVTEYNKHIQGFLVDSVETIQRLAWDNVKAPPPMLANSMGGIVTAITELSDDRLVMIMDVEKVLADTAQFASDDSVFAGIGKMKDGEHKRVLFADDSSVARDQVKGTLEHMGIEYISANNGAEAWHKLLGILKQAKSQDNPITNYIHAIITDVEMPEMDGYVLTRKIKEHPELTTIPVIMHSSLSADANQMLGKGVGANTYVPKFQPVELSNALKKLMA